MPDNTPEPAVAPVDSRSSLVSKLPADLRRRLDQALVDRQPATYRETYDHFKLQEKGVSYTAFYYYARRVRVSAALVESVSLVPEGAPPAQDLLPEICAQRFLEASLDENASSRRLHRLAEIYRIASHTSLERRRLDFEIKRANLQDVEQVKREVIEAIADSERIRQQRLEAEAALAAARDPSPSPASPTPIDPQYITDENVPPHPPNPVAPSPSPRPLPGTTPPKTKAAVHQVHAVHRVHPPCRRFPIARARIPSRTHLCGNPFPCIPYSRRQPGTIPPESQVAVLQVHTVHRVHPPCRRLPSGASSLVGSRRTSRAFLGGAPASAFRPYCWLIADG